MIAGRSAIISGGSQGLGYAIAKQFIAEGANVLLAARDQAALEAARVNLLKEVPHANIHIKPTDVSCPQQVTEMVDRALQLFNRVEILVANAGVYGTKGPLESINWEEWSRAIDINLKGTVLQCRSLLPHFKQQAYGKIIILSGGGATKPLPNLSAYAASKAALVRFAETLALEVSDFGIDVNSVAPGALNTRLLDEILLAGPEKVGREFYLQSLQQKESGGTPLGKGAALCAFLASAASDGITGRLLSAVWDPWTKLPELANELKQTDIYTLRRILPQDRGKDWDGIC